MTTFHLLDTIKIDYLAAQNMLAYAIIFILLFFNSLTVEPIERQKIDNKELSAIFNIGTIHGLMIHKNGEIIYEDFRGSARADRPVNIKSASKSVLSLLIGIAIDKGYLEGTHQTIDHFFPDWFEQNPDPVKESLTIQDLLTMRTGLETTSSRNYGRWAVSNSWIQFALNQPIVNEPGGRMIYSTGTSHLLSVILTRSSGMSTRDFANKYLFEPMNVHIGGWDRGPDGYYMGGNNMAMSPEDMIKIGELMMNMGQHDGQQLISKSWILESVQSYTQSNYNPYNYGYMWWHKPVGDYTVFFAWGNGGQYIMILPELDAVISITSSLRANAPRRYQREVFQFLDDTIVPYLENYDKSSKS